MNQEQAVIEAIQAGNRERFAELYDLYVKKIYRFVYFKTLHREIAEDLTSKAFLKALQSIDSADSKRPFSPWIYEIARNTVIDHFRKEKRTSVPIEDAWDLAGDDHIEQDAERKRMFADVQKHMQSLTPEQREIVILRIWEDLSYREIAEAVGKSEENCKVIFSRSIAKLRNLSGSVALISLLAFISTL